MLDTFINCIALGLTIFLTALLTGLVAAVVVSAYRVFMTFIWG